MNESDIDPEFAYVVAEQIALIKEIDAVLMPTYQESVRTMNVAMQVLCDSYQRAETTPAELEYATNLWLDTYWSPLLDELGTEVQTAGFPNE